GEHPMSVVACPSCDARLQPHEIAEGWCETCGKKIPAWALHEAPGTPAPRCPRCGVRLTSGEMKAARCRSCRQSWKAAGAEAGGPGDRGPAAVGSVLHPSP